VGCSGQETTAGDAPVRNQDDYGAAAFDQLKKAANVTDMRDALGLYDEHASQEPDLKKSIREEIQQLQGQPDLHKQLALDDDEIVDITSPAMQPLDAYHVLSCLQLRDVADSLQLSSLPPLRRTLVAFDWVMRHVMLVSDDRERLQPPLVVLDNGQGNAQERALVFLALIDQLNPDETAGCMIAVAGASADRPRYWLPGVLVHEPKQINIEQDRDNIYLFDTRLGLPLPGPDGPTSVATLAEIRKEPRLIESLALSKDWPYDVTPAQAAGAVPHLVLPLGALAPRLKVLEGWLKERQEAVHLTVNFQEMLKRFEQASGGPVKVWNRRSESAQNRALTPTRVLRLYYPSADGALRPKVGAEQDEMWPLAVVGFQELRLNINEDVSRELLSLCQSLYSKYIYTPRSGLWRGTVEEATRKLSRIERLVPELRQQAPPPQEFHDQVAAWSARVKEAFLAESRKEPGAEGKFGRTLREDMYLQVLARAEDEEEQPRPKGILTFALMEVIGDGLRNDATYLLAQTWQDKAARAQAGVSGENVRLAWENAENWAQRYAEQHPLALAAVQPRVQAASALWQRLGRSRNPLEHKIAQAQWEALFRDLRRAATARLVQASALEGMGKPQAARAVFQQLADQLEALGKDPEMKAALENCLRVTEGLGGSLHVQAQTFFRQRQEDLRQGSLYWLGYSARLRERWLKS
jgi:hypothetical protein